MPTGSSPYTNTNTTYYIPWFQGTTSSTTSLPYYFVPPPRTLEVEFAAVSEERWHDMPEDVFEAKWAKYTDAVRKWRKDQKVSGTAFHDSDAPAPKTRKRK